MTTVIARPAIIPPDAVEVVRGCWQWDLSASVRVCAIGVQADPLKDSVAWLEAQRETMPANEFAREYLLDFGVYGGKAVYPEYQDRYHAATQPLAYVPNRPLLRGWDVPGPVGVVWLQRVPVRAAGPTGQFDTVSRVHVLTEFLSEGSVAEAGRTVQAMTRELFPQATDFIDVADPAAFNRIANDAQSCADILRRECAIHLVPGALTLTERLEGVRRWLLGVVPTAAQTEPPGRLLVDPSCPRLKESLRSAYHYRPLPGAQARYHDLPDKGWGSHLPNALEYALSRLEGAGDARPAVPQPALEFTHALGAVHSMRQEAPVWR